MMRNIKTLIISVIASTTLILLCASASAQHVYYRYINKEGVKVLDQSIPPEYAQSGYEVLNASGQVVKVVPPAPSEEELERNALERETQEKYARLKRRYSSSEAIESAKQRRLKNIDTNITVLKGNITSLNNHMDELMSQAANAERQGRKVPQHLLDKMQNTRDELAVAKELLGIRKHERQEVIDKFDEDKRWFSRGEALEKNGNAKIE